MMHCCPLEPSVLPLAHTTPGLFDFKVHFCEIATYVVPALDSSRLVDASFVPDVIVLVLMLFPQE